MGSVGSGRQAVGSGRQSTASAEFKKQSMIPSNLADNVCLAKLTDRR